MDPYLATAISRARSGSYPDICDAELILAELDKVSAERNEYRAKLMNLADASSVKGMSWGGFNVIGDDKSIDAVQSAVHYGGQIDEYRAAFLQRKAALEAERDAWAKHLPVEIVEQGLEITRCHHRIAVLEAALSYYAKEHKNPSEGPWGLNSTDFGNVARRALEDSHN